MGWPYPDSSISLEAFLPRNICNGTYLALMEGSRVAWPYPSMLEAPKGESRLAVEVNAIL